VSGGCRVRSRERSRLWRLENPKRQNAHYRRHHLKKKFGITPEDYEDMVAAQDGKCAICATADTSPDAWFCVDHDHTTGKVRGLLCRTCNTSIGQAGDDPARLRKAIAYLERA
jgi:hypothetical protein